MVLRRACDVSRQSCASASPTALDVVLRRKDPLIPPRRLRYVGEGDYAEVGDTGSGCCAASRSCGPTSACSTSAAAPACSRAR